MNRQAALALGIIGLMLVVWIGVERFQDQTPQDDGRAMRPVGMTEPVLQNVEGQPERGVDRSGGTQPPARRLTAVIAIDAGVFMAIILDETSGIEKRYKLGDRVLPDEAELTEIRTREVVLEHSEYGRQVLKLGGSQKGADAEPRSAYTPEAEVKAIAQEIEREMEAAFGPDPYRFCEEFTTGAEEAACLKDIDARIDDRVEACDAIDDTERYAECIEAANSLQPYPAIE